MIYIFCFLFFDKQGYIFVLFLFFDKKGYSNLFDYLTISLNMCSPPFPHIADYYREESLGGDAKVRQEVSNPGSYGYLEALGITKLTS